MKKITILLLTLVCYFGAKAQTETDQVYKPFVMELENGAEKRTFVLSSFNHYISSYIDSTNVRFQQVSISLAMPITKDDWILQWVTNPNKEMSGRFIVRDPKTGDTVNEYKFVKAFVENTAESYYFGDNYSNDSKNIQLVLSCSEFSIGKYPVLNIKSQRYW